MPELLSSSVRCDEVASLSLATRRTEEGRRHAPCTLYLSLSGDEAGGAGDLPEGRRHGVLSF